MEGVIRTRVGYAGGSKGNPSYRSLGGHSEAIQIDFDAEKISYEDLLRAFWDSHEPASQSWSRQYRNVLFYHDEEQKALALRSKERLEAATGRRVATDIVPYEGFHLAEDYHQKHALQRYPWLMEELRAAFPDFGGVVNSTAAARINGYLAGYGSCETLRGQIGRLGLSESSAGFLLEAACGRTTRPLACPVPGRTEEAGE